ncbi:flagellin [Rhizobium halophilum]|uniref:flagellin n=1 Tax=Rhizobium halophilum TaxID=2846852 RepID=UPI001EFC5935|nr:flagellin [Rhizobium halophilum]MCF6369552.1 flagellin [Rhizobium halophilum]
MTSILTNVAAMAALQTLRGIDSQMEDTQARVSSGLRVGTASDNAAYWSIATTMRSDNLALSTVQDALGLGAAKVDTAYSAMETVVEVMKEIKAKLVAATEDGVDKSKIQEEISQLQDQLKSISESASFSGENWLQSDLTNGPVVKSVVGSFVRSEDGSVSVKKVNYTLDSSTVLFDQGTQMGLLDREAVTGADTVSLADVPVAISKVSTATITDLTAAGGTLGTTAITAPVADNVESFTTTGGDLYVRYYSDTGVIQLDDNGNELWARVVATNVVPADLGAAHHATGADMANGANVFYYQEDIANKTVSVTALSGADVISLNASGLNYNISGRVATEVLDPTNVWIQLDPTTDVWVNATTVAPAPTDLSEPTAEGILIGGVPYYINETNQTLPAELVGASLGFSVSTLDITDLDAVAAQMGGMSTEADALDFMVQYLDTQLEAIVSATSALGSIAMRIGMQEDFISKLTDSIDSGIGRLVDADMNEESTRLKALQTQQQLAIQSLSIANTASENILTLFRQ